MIFWRPKGDVDMFLPPAAPLGERIRTEVLAGAWSDALQPMPSAELLQAIHAGFPGATFRDDGSVYWCDELGNGFIAGGGRQYVDVCAFDIDDDAFEKIWDIAERFACTHYDLGN